MTILERVEAQHDREAFDRGLVAALSGVPGAVALAVTERPSGTLGVLVVDDAASDYEKAEEQAFDAVAPFEYEHAEVVFDLIVLPIAQAADFDIGETARLHDLRRPA